MAACRSTVRLVAAFADVFFSDGRRRVLLIKLNPCPSARSEVLGAGLDRCFIQVWQ
jgi:hypothetical protein